jgi:hypothetical protein
MRNLRIKKVLEHRTNGMVEGRNCSANDGDEMELMAKPGNTKGGSITVPLTSCLTGLESGV